MNAPALPLRSWLFVPGDSERKLEKALASGADVLILDLEDAVAAPRKAVAREMVTDYLKEHRDRSRQQLWVRINPLDAPEALADLAVVAGRPDGVLLPKVFGPAQVVQLSHMLDALEVREGIERQSVAIVPVATETPQAFFALGNYAGCSPRLAGLTWGAEDIAAALGASSNRGPDGEYDHPFQLAQTLCLLGAHAAQVQAIDTVHTAIADTAGLEREARRARQRGFTGKIAIHPAQVPIINAAFTPSAQELDHARQVVQLFESQPELGAVALDGQMLDMPHLKQARRILQMLR